MDCKVHGVKVRKEDVISACKNALSIIKIRRLSAYRNAIKCRMNSIFFLYPDRIKASRQIRKKIQDDGFSQVAIDVTWKGWTTIADAEELISACNVCDDDHIYLTTEDASFVNYYLKKTL